jgi:glycosyltransferase involved in cell wall biosynthesis
VQATILLVTHHDPCHPARTAGGGRELLSALNYEALRATYGDRLHVLTLQRSPVRSARALCGAFRGHIDGLSSHVIDGALQVISADRVSRIFVDGSNLGALVRGAKQRYPQVPITTFFHNAEVRFFLGALFSSMRPRAAAVLAVNYLAERNAIRYSDNVVCLSERDSQTLRRIYGRGATHIFPMALKDARSAADTLPAPVPGPYLLFVGGPFYANLAGVEWFAANVAPSLPVRTVIVGKGFEQYRDRLQVSGKLDVIGRVDALEPWYRHAALVVAPIFDGSGMKTKVAEALMYGKRIVGTPEAFSGYEDVIQKPEWFCRTADDFVTTIRRLLQEEQPLFDPALRALYQQHFSFDAARHRLAQVVGVVQ